MNPLMETISILHSWQVFLIRTMFSLYFRIEKIKYLYGLSYTLDQDYSTLNKMQIDFIIIPTFPYTHSLNAFLWNFHALRTIKCQHFIVQNQNVKKHVEKVFATIVDHKINISQYKWSFFPEKEIDQTQIQLEIIKSQCKLSNLQPLTNRNFNQNINLLSVLLSENSRTFLLINQCETIIVDPCENIEGFLKECKVPLKSIVGILLTNDKNLNLIQLLLKMPKITIISVKQIYKSVIDKMKKILLLTSQMIENKIDSRVIEQSSFRYKFAFVDLSYHGNYSSEKESPFNFWDVSFGLKVIRIYPQQVVHYPTEITSIEHLELLILYEIEEENKKILEKIPEVFRKKIVLNRVKRKCNNKYFVTLKVGSPNALVIQADPHVAGKLKQSGNILQLKYKYKDKNCILSSKTLQHLESFNSLKRIVYLTSGYVCDQNNQIYSFGDVIIATRQLTAVDHAYLMFLNQQQFYLYQHWKHIFYSQNYQLHENLLIKVQTNSFISSLSKTNKTEFHIRNQQSTIFKQKHNDFQVNSEWYIFNKICKAVSLSAGSFINKDNNAVYLVIKGALKYENKEVAAVKNMFIGNLRAFYEQDEEESVTIEVIKDTWALQVSIEVLDKQFFSIFPEVLYKLLCKDVIFD